MTHWAIDVAPDAYKQISYPTELTGYLQTVCECPDCDGYGRGLELAGGWSEPNYRSVRCERCSGAGDYLYDDYDHDNLKPAYDDLRACGVIDDVTHASALLNAIEQLRGQESDPRFGAALAEIRQQLRTTRTIPAPAEAAE